MSSSEGIQTRAWYQLGTLKGTDPGYLVLTPEQRLIFVGGDGSRFDAPLSAVTDVKFPRHWFDGGCKLAIAGQEHRVDFVRPNGAPDPSGRLGELGFGAGAFGAAADVVEVGRKLRDIGSGRAAGKQWKRILTEPQIATGGEDAAERPAPAVAAAPSPPPVEHPAHPAGWYADPHGAARLRWWDGGRWTEHVAP